jgi:hypothetical protein
MELPEPSAQKESGGKIIYHWSFAIYHLAINAEGVSKFQPRASPWEQTILHPWNSERVGIDQALAFFRRNPFRVGPPFMFSYPE